MTHKPVAIPGEKGSDVDTSALVVTGTLPQWEEQRNVDDLPPRDRGRAAWTCLAAISAISMVTWGSYTTMASRFYG